MSNSGKCIIPGVKFHAGTISIANFRPKSSAEAVGVVHGLDTLGFGELGDGVVGNMFLIHQFRSFAYLRFTVRNKAIYK